MDNPIDAVNDPLLHAEEVAQRLQISIALAYRLIQTGQIRCVRIGRLVRVRSSDLERFIQQQLSGDEATVGR